MNLPYLLVGVLAIITAEVESAKILGLFWTPSRSHHIAGSALLQALARKGHDVHLMSSYNDKVDIPTFKQELLHGIVGSLDSQTNPNISAIDKFLDILPSFRRTAEKFYQNECIRKLIKEKPKYDVVIILTFFNDFILGMAHHLEAPSIIFSSTGSSHLLNKFVGNPNLPYAKSMVLETDVDTFVGRLTTVTFNAVTLLAEKYILSPMHDGVNQKYLPNIPPVVELTKTVSLVLANSHFAIEEPRPYVPNMIQIGGFHTQSPKKLPEDLQKYMDSAKRGVILFGMGTNIKIKKNFEPKQLDAIMKGLAKVAPVKVLFKSEIEIPNTPANVLISNWLPQNEVLAHPNMKLFISHGGLGGVTEAVFHGVPLLGIPFFADQKANIISAVGSGFALSLKNDNITEESFSEVLTELLRNPKYAQNAKKRSSLLRNQPMKPVDKAIWWVEHIIEHNGGEHLRNIAMKFEWYQLYMVDIMAFFLALILTILTITFFTTRWTLRKICRLLGLCGKNDKVKTS